ncbi:unnamed protein product [Ambrosiozyma monospora]|uniref:Unnamed protein product n=1 Tax=Ambrosiozyma monospora TaxID=43982 RepID=A0A9W6YUN1_AMBMO|nr:unnamed protein product [Ambrosiozyma monospora]
MKVRSLQGVKRRTTSKLKHSTTSKKDTRHIIVTTTDNVESLFESAEGEDKNDYPSSVIPAPKPVITLDTSTLLPPSRAPRAQHDYQSQVHTPTSDEVHLMAGPYPSPASSPATSPHSRHHPFHRSHKLNRSNSSSLPSFALNGEEATLVTNRSHILVHLHSRSHSRSRCRSSSPSTPSLSPSRSPSHSPALAATRLGANTNAKTFSSPKPEPDLPGGRTVIRSKTSKNVLISKHLTPFDKDEMMKKKLQEQSPLQSQFEETEWSWWEEHGSTVIMYSAGGVIGIGLLALMIKLICLLVQGLVLFAS